MKHWMKGLAIVLAAVLMTGCITIEIDPGSNTTKAEDKTTEAPADKTTEAPEDKTTEAPEDKTTEAPEVETTAEALSDAEKAVLGTWAGKGGNETRIILRADHTAFYTELLSIHYKTMKGIEAEWTFENGTVKLTVSGYELGGKPEGDQWTVKCYNGKPWTDETLERTSTTEAAILQEIEDNLNHGLKDGNYTSSSFHLEDGVPRDKAAYDKEWADFYEKYDMPLILFAYLEDGWIVIEGRVGRDLYNGGDPFMSEYKRFWLPLSENCKVFSSGGDGPDIEVPLENVNNAFFNNGGLGLFFKLENGKVTEISISS